MNTPDIAWPLRFTRFLGCLLFVAAFASPQAQQIGASLPSGPFVPFVTPTTATIAWISDYANVSYGVIGSEAVNPVFRMSQTTLRDLKPGSLVHYSIPGVGSGQFQTPPAPGDPVTPYSFVVFGDNRTRHDIYRKVAAEVAAVKPAYIIHTGDLVERGRDPGLWLTFFDISRELLRRTVFFASLGNHEENSPFWYQFFAQPAGYYSFDWGSVHWVVLNSNAVPPDPEIYWAKQIAWLDKDLEANQKADYLFVTFHHPPYTAMKSRQPAAARIAGRLVPVFKKHRVSAVFAGHDHNYQHHKEGGIAYIVTGGGGAPLYDIDGAMDITLKAEKVENFVLCNVRTGAIRCEARALGGRVIDKVDFTPRKPSRAAP